MEPSLPDLLPSWQLALTSENKSLGTIKTYTNGVNAYLKWCRGEGVPAILDKSTVQRWVAEMLAGGAEPTTAKARQHALKMFSAWLYREGEIATHELADIKPPRLSSKVVHSLSDEQVREMIAACKGKGFTDRRDEALIRFMAETGARASEVLALQVSDVNLTSQVAIIHKGKGAKGRVVPFSPTCAASIDRYIRIRRRLRIPEPGPLWAGAQGKTFGYYGLRLALHKRARKAKIEGFHLHLLRHTFATRWLRQKGSEGGLMAIAGWSNREMIDRYTGASASERANEEARKLNLGF